MSKQYPPEVLAACMQRGIPPDSVAGYEVTDADVFLNGPTGVIRIEISSLPEQMLELFRTQQVQVGKKPERTKKQAKKAAPRSTAKRKKTKRAKR
jgi:hypothetical protein